MEEKIQEEIKKSKFSFPKRFLTGYSLVFIIVLVFVSGFAVGRLPLSEQAGDEIGGEIKNEDEDIPAYLSEDVDFRLFWQTWDYIKDNYIESDVPETQLFYGALAGLVASLQDPYSVFLDPEVSERFEKELAGSFEGIGSEIGLKNSQLTIIAPLPDTPADRAGLRPGDKVLAIDGYDSRGIALDYAVSLIRGPKGEEVVLTILSNGGEEARDVSIIRDTIEIDSVKFSRKISGNPEEAEEDFLMEGDIAYIELLYFNENTLEDWNKTVQKVILANPKGIILDLRSNPGGFLGTAIEITGEWINGKTVVLEKSRSGEKTAHKANRQARFEDIPTVVLVNRGSASGSEIVAGALQDYGVATIIGETTFGKGSIQDLREFKGGSSVKLTIAEWLTPNERQINEVGIVPDVEVELTREDYDNDLDPQLDRALEILNNKVE